MKQIMCHLVRCGIVAFSIASSSLYAAGYKLEFQSPSFLADAGEAAAINDAGTNWYNSAGLVYLPQQAVFSAIDVYAPTTFTGTVTGGSVFGPTFAFNSSGSASSHPNNVLPAMHYSYPFKERFAVGVSIVPAWGFTEDYGEHSILRYDLTRVYTRTLDVAPSLAWKIDHQWSIGAGPDMHYFYVSSKSHVFTEGAPPGFATPGDSITRFSANNWGYGGHVGVLYRFNDSTRIGLNYRTQMMMNLDGFSDFELNGVGSFESRSFKLHVALPPTTTLSVYHEVTPCIALLGTLAYDQWNVLRNYHAKNYIQPPTPGNPTGILPDVVQPQNMSNTIDVSIGSHYKLTEKWLLRGSIKYEPTPTNDQYRDVNFPDGVKLGFQIGSRYQYNKKIAVDLIYGHVFVRSTHINGVSPQQIFPNTVVANGHNNTSVDLLGAQIVWNI
jgi:long-chain fatty acid transport protein